MLHGTLPRAYLSPGLNYFGGFYGEDIQHAAYQQTASYVALEDPYTRLGDHRLLQASPWDGTLRPTSPLPLDLSLKPQVSCSSIASSPRIDDEAIEVDDEEDRKDRVQKRLDQKLVPRLGDEPMSDEDKRTVFDMTKPDPLALTRLSYSEPLVRKYQFPSQKMVLTSPTRLQTVANYHQQFLLTPPQNLHGIHAPMTPPSTPSPPQCTKRRSKEEEAGSPDAPPVKVVVQTVEKVTKAKKKHVARRLKFDEDTSSPVSGTVILGPDEAVVTGDIDPAFNVVEVTEEARAELAKIENRLGPYQCKLCRQLYEDAFQLAQHRCSRIAHVEYRCPECDKRFSCPANLASHRRWHKPRVTSADAANALALASMTSGSSGSASGDITCNKCDAKFSRQTALRKHMTVQHSETNNNNNSNVNNNMYNNNSNNNNGHSDSNVGNEGSGKVIVGGNMTEQMSSVVASNEAA